MLRIEDEMTGFIEKNRCDHEETSKQIHTWASSLKIELNTDVSGLQQSIGDLQKNYELMYDNKLDSHEMIQMKDRLNEVLNKKLESEQLIDLETKIMGSLNEVKHALVDKIVGLEDGMETNMGQKLDRHEIDTIMQGKIDSTTVTDYTAHLVTKDDFLDLKSAIQSVDSENQNTKGMYKALNKK